MNRHLLIAATACYFMPGLASAAEYSFKLDGKTIHPDIISLRAAPEKPQADDLVLVADILLTLGEATEQEFRTTPKEDGRLLGVTKDGVKTVGARVSFTYIGDKKINLNPLERMSSEEIRHLRGVCIDDWNDAIATRLRHINPERACVTIQASFAKRKWVGLSLLPTTLRYLQVLERSNLGVEDFSWLARYPSLRFLAVHAMSSAIDLRALQNASELQYLDLRGSELKNGEALGVLRRLRYLNIAFTRGIDSVTFAGTLPALALLDLQSTQVKDLSPLGSSQALVAVIANQAPIGTLPQGKMAALRNLKVMSTDLNDESIAAFSGLNPQCQVIFRWKPYLDKALKDVTRLRVRSGGTCHRDLSCETTLFEIKNATEVSKLLERIGIDESQSGFHCMCCGTPSFEFYKDDRLVLTLGFHHGQGVRWPDVWPGDAALTAESADSLCQWLADHGVMEPLDQRLQQKRMEESAKRRMARYVALIPQKVVQQLDRGGSAAEAGKAFEDGIADPKERARLFLQLFGCDNGSWSHYNGLDEPLKEAFLPNLPAQSLSAVLAESKDEYSINGAARWLFGEAKWKAVDTKTLNTVLPLVGKRALTHPRQHNRKVAIQALSEIKTGEASLLLRAFLAGVLKPRSLGQGEQTEPGGMLVAHPGDDELAKTSERALAAMALARIGDRESLPTLQHMAKTASGHDKEVLQAAISLLEQTK